MLPVQIEFIEGNYGEAYGVTKEDKITLIEGFERSLLNFSGGCNLDIHTLLAKEILSIPPDVVGDVAECGVWKGTLSASLSLVCKLVNRKFLVCDSFQGLPDDNLDLHLGLCHKVYGYYKKGMYEGTLEEVKANITKFGNIEVCEFIPGFFKDSLSKLTNPIAFAFLDVDLVSSTKDCLQYIWPLLVEGGLLYTDDSTDLDVVKIFFNDAWWNTTLGCNSPGYIGSGCGLDKSYMSLGFTRKITKIDLKEWNKRDWLHYPEDK
jgi:O-methyltransferase